MPSSSVRSLIARSAVLALSLALPLRVAAQPDPAPAAPRPFSILITNDDGFEAPGLQALVKALAGLGDLYVAAPSQNQSGAGHSVTLSTAVVVHERPLEGVVRAVAVDGAPATAARVGLEKYLPTPPDLVISGVNRGENLGMSVYLSGTLGAAREAVFAGVPAIAVSMMGNRPETYESAAAVTRSLVESLRAKDLVRPGLFLNVNVPAGAVKGTRVTRLSVRASRVEHECSPPMRQRVACFPAFRQLMKDEAGTDIAAFYDGYVSVTPMTLDVTDTSAAEALREVEAIRVPAATAAGGGAPMNSAAGTSSAGASSAIAAVERFNGAINRQDLDALGAAVTDDVVFDNTNPAPDGTRYEGRAAVVAFWQKWFAANAGARFETEEIFAAGDRVVVRWVYRKVRDGRPWHIKGVDVFRVRDGRVAEKLSYVKG